MMILVLRSFKQGMIAMIPNVCPAAVGYGVLGWMDYPIDIGMAMTACVALGIAVDDSVHFITHWHEARRKGMNSLEAVLDALKVKGRPIVASSAALVAVFSLFALCSFPPVVSFGVLCAVAFLGALVSALVTSMTTSTLW